MYKDIEQTILDTINLKNDTTFTKTTNKIDRVTDIGNNTIACVLTEIPSTQLPVTDYSGVAEVSITKVDMSKYIPSYSPPIFVDEQTMTGQQIIDKINKTYSINLTDVDVDYNAVGSIVWDVNKPSPKQEVTVTIKNTSKDCYGTFKVTFVLTKRTLNKAFTVNQNIGDIGLLQKDKGRLNLNLVLMPYNFSDVAEIKNARVGTNLDLTADQLNKIIGKKLNDRDNWGTGKKYYLTGPFRVDKVDTNHQIVYCTDISNSTQTTLWAEMRFPLIDRGL